MDKSEILREFSRDPDRHYAVRLFGDEGFERRSCSVCGRFFWSADPGASACPDDSDDTYSFIGDPPTPRRFDYTESWRQVREFFVSNGHTAVSRYPVVCRWRDDLYFTIASIVDFQRVMGSKVVFEFPANPLVVPQTCLRFKDLENVGVTGRHFSSFCMIGQHSVPDRGGYWKDECMDLDFGLLTKQFGIPKHEVTFVEDVWAGGGSFGPSLEYFVRGLEIGNAVFTEFQGRLGEHTRLDQRIIDMGAGLERFAWITTGTPTAYDCCFGPVTGRLFGALGIDQDHASLAAYYTAVAKNLDRHDVNTVRRIAMRAAGITDSQAGSVIAPLEGAYMIADHLRTLIFAISDGALPSNVGGGYNLRMMLRRIIATADRIGLGLDIDELVDMHVDYLRDTYPELDSRRGDVKTILNIEAGRYADSKSRMGAIAARMSDRGQVPGTDDLLTLYESDGITPEYLREAGIIDEIPASFYSRLSELHQSDRRPAADSLPLDGVPETEMLFYMDDPTEWDARVLRVFGDRVVLDRTSFYARGGGQEPDHGAIGECEVTDVTKHAGVLVHTVRGAAPPEGSTIHCRLDRARREAITKNHTGTHILNSSARRVLGSWVWQHSAFKDADHARLDITHHSPLESVEVRRIEDAANEIIRQDMAVSVREHDRGEAERLYGFRIYQGGVVPVRSVRIVAIGDYDVEACGGTHVPSTGEIGTLRITRTKRIQDGVTRIEFVTGPDAQSYAVRQESDRKISDAREADRARRHEMRDQRREQYREDIPRLIEQIVSLSGGQTIQGIEVRTDGSRRCFTTDGAYDENFHIDFGRRLIAADPASTYCGVFESGPTVRIMVYAGPDAPGDAIDMVREVSAVLGGSGGGDAVFAQGGGRDTSKKGAAISKARSMVLGHDTVG